MSDNSTTPEAMFEVQSGYSSKNRRPFVELSYDGASLKVSPDEARDIAFSLIGAAEAAEQDGFLFEFMTNQVGVEGGMAAAVIVEYREYRERGRQVEPLGAAGSS